MSAEQAAIRLSTLTAISPTQCCCSEGGSEVFCACAGDAVIADAKDRTATARSASGRAARRGDGIGRGGIIFNLGGGGRSCQLWQIMPENMAFVSFEAERSRNHRAVMLTTSANPKAGFDRGGNIVSAA